MKIVGFISPLKKKHICYTLKILACYIIFLGTEKSILRQKGVTSGMAASNKSIKGSTIQGHYYK